MAEWLSDKLQSLGVKVESRPLGKQMLEGQELDLPPALLGELGNDPNKVCLVLHQCVYLLTLTLNVCDARKPSSSTDTSMFNLQACPMVGFTILSS
jgi:hypothetical protein